MCPPSNTHWVILSHACGSHVLQESCFYLFRVIFPACFLVIGKSRVFLTDSHLGRTDTVELNILVISFSFLHSSFWKVHITSYVFYEIDTTSL